MKEELLRFLAGAAERFRPSSLKESLPLSKLRDAFVVLGVLLAFYYILTPPAGQQAGYFTCSRNADCISGVCVRGVCRESPLHCGDSYCDWGENCSSCPGDCGTCGLPDGAGCERDTQCNGTCVHGVCRPTDPYHGDGWCDEGEDCWTAPGDCGQCMWI